jgi:4-amino-4-deoxy-L-arabinose transferase-like glycosyltransferase
LGLGAIVLLGLAFRFWARGRTRDGDRFGATNLYYAAGAPACWTAGIILLQRFDPAGFVSLDKPPVAFWIQVLSAKIFGFGAFSVLAPQLIEGGAAILLLHHLGRPADHRDRRAGDGDWRILRFRSNPVAR